MRIALCGPSGTGKTTLAEYISKEYFNTPFIQGSASLIMSNKTREELKQRFGYEPLGHKNVVNMSSINPEFGMAFQEKLLDARLKRLVKEENFVTDRSPIDNIVYYLTQCSHNSTEERTRLHITKALVLAEHLTHIINIRFVNPDEIEDNGSRVTNKYFQGMVDSVFQTAIENYFIAKGSLFAEKRLLTLDMWDLTTRKKLIRNWL